ncbi:MAG: hypothetical protein A2705_03630 [Omnitrophica WOR_2 bacterium RIFCSPHIGHO2_01_FULL_52_10]|nr:MAG: hypothetical protein A2705_03630 [Omnitrophica WOR_2 bacterium RIFCSPHIGHO2_01_FULL_52_10]
MKLYIGTSGYDYSHWGSGIFYHSGLPADKWLEFYSRQFNGVELITTFSQPPEGATVEAWLKSTPREFRFSVKGSSYITHIKRLEDVEESLETLAHSVQLLKPKIACFLWQLPPGFKKDHQGLADFCSLLKRTRFFQGFRHVFEFADASWFSSDVYRILKDYRCCLCFTESSEKPGEWVVTTDFIYARFNGGKAFYNSQYSRNELEQLADKVRAFRDKVHTVYAFFNNDEQGFAVYNAQTFRMLLLERRML